MASGSSNQIIKLWDISKHLKPSRLLSRTLRRHLKFSARQECKVVGSISFLKYAVDGLHLITNLGLITIESILMQCPEFKSLENLGVKDDWTCYETMPFLRLPSGFEPVRYDVQDDQVAIGCTNDRVLCFDINRRNLS